MLKGLKLDPLVFRILKLVNNKAHYKAYFLQSPNIKSIELLS